MTGDPSDPDERIVVLDVSTVARPDLATIDLLARFELAARRLGRHVELRGASPRLQELLTLAGLADGPAGLLGVDEGQPEQREQLGGQEVRDVGDPTA